VSVGFRHLMRTIAPPWLNRTWGERFLYAHAVQLDAVAEWALQGLKARFPAKAPLDALPYIGRDRKIRRGFAESAEAYIVRLQAWLDSHRRRGNAIALLEQLHGYFTPYSSSMRFSTVDDGGTWFVMDGADKSVTITRKADNWDWDGAPATQWGRFWVIIHPLSSGAFTDAGDWSNDESYGADGAWGLSLSPDQCRDLIAIVRDWKPAGVSCIYIVASLDAGELNPDSTTLPDGTWSQSAKVSGGVWVPTRPSWSRWIGEV